MLLGESLRERAALLDVTGSQADAESLRTAASAVESDEPFAELTVWRSGAEDIGRVIVGRMRSEAQQFDLAMDLHQAAWTGGEVVLLPERVSVRFGVDPKVIELDMKLEREAA